MLERILIAGSGGQGVLLIGKLLADVALRTVPHITYFPSYGAEVRGGTSNCQVVLSADEICSPVSERFDAEILLNQPSTDQFFERLEPDGLGVINTSLARAPAGRQTLAIPASDIANDIGDVRAANFVMLGAYLARQRILPAEDMEQAIHRKLDRKNPAMAEINLKAFRAGLAL